MASQAGYFTLQEFTDAGLPLIGGRLYTYAAGTTTFKTAYTDAAGVVPQTYTADGSGGQYLALNARAELPAPLYLATGSYDIALKRADGSTVWTRQADPTSSDVLAFNYSLSYVAGTVGRWLQDLVLAAGSTFIGWQQAGAGLLRTVSDKLRDQVTVFDYMTAAQIADVRSRTGSLDVTAAIQAAINAASPTGRVYFPAGIYKTTSQLLVNINRVHLIGAGSYATQITFAPTANGTCLKVAAASSVISQGSICGFTFFSNDSTFTKTALELVDIDIYKIYDITIAGSIVSGGSVFWSGANSIGIRTRGRDLSNFKGITIFADLPIVMSINPNNSISVDHFHFSDCYLGANGNPNITVETGVNITQLTFDGYQAWVLGTAGFKWIDTTSTQTSEGVNFYNVRAEQGTDNTQYMFDIEHNQQLQGVGFHNCYGGFDRRGFKLRKCLNVLIDHHTHAGTLEALNVDTTVVGMRFLECFWQAGSTAVMSGQRALFSTPNNPNTAPLPPDAVYDITTNAARTVTVDAAMSGTVFTLANNATLALGPNIGGTISVISSEGFGACYIVHGGQNAVDLIAGTTSSGFYSATLGTASKINLGYTVGQYTIENKRGASVNLKLAVLGSYGAI